MDELLLVLGILTGLVSGFGLYLAISNLLQHYYAYTYNMRNFPKTYVVRYIILSKPAKSDSDSESDSESDSDATEELEPDIEPESESESEPEPEPEPEQNQDPSAVVGGSNLMRVVLITCSPSDLVKKIKHAISFNDSEELFQLVGIELIDYSS